MLIDTVSNTLMDAVQTTSHDINNLYNLTTSLVQVLTQPDDTTHQAVLLTFMIPSCVLTS